MIGYSLISTVLKTGNWNSKRDVVLLLILVNVEFYKYFLQLSFNEVNWNGKQEGRVKELILKHSRQRWHFKEPTEQSLQKSIDYYS